MSTQVETIRVASADPASQGPFVVINKADFNPEVHKLFEEEAAEAPKKRGAKQPTTEA